MRGGGEGNGDDDDDMTRTVLSSRCHIIAVVVVTIAVFDSVVVSSGM
jgi:hypothetical protein